MSFHRTIRTIIRLSAVLAVVALAKGCGDGESPSAPPTPEPARPTTVMVSPATHELTALGETVQLTAEVRDQNARVMAGATVTWTSSASSVATVDAAGLVRAVGNGTATITASAGSASGSTVVTVTQSVATVDVSPATADLTALGATAQLTAAALDGNGHAVAGAEFSWESSDAAVATVDAAGLVTGVAKGTATITASAGGAQGTAEITVMDRDRAALVALYEATGGPNWVNNENWLTDAPLGEWYGVDTDNSGRVVRLDLDGRWDSDAREYIPHGLSGPIPPELGNLTDLTRLDLGHNFLSGPVPTELGSLADLESLHLGGNDLAGPIPTELGKLASLTGLWLYSNSLTGEIPLGLGNLASLTRLDLRGNDLSGPIPTELGELASLTWLSLSSNSLTGAIPTELGSLADLESLYLSYNDLTGPIPESFLELEALERFRFERNADLCAPGTIDFVTWLARIETVSGPYCNESNVGVLNLLYETSGGPDWTNSSGWLETPALDEWYGVTADALGRILTLDLSRNGLAGQLPGNLSELAHMTELRIAHNTELSGRLPLSLADLSLRALHYAGTELCAPGDTSFRDWLSAIPSHEGTGAECGPLSDREILEILFEATGGPNWTNNDNWLSDAPLGDWYGVGVDSEGRVAYLSLQGNALAGSIPPELGNLTRLRSLRLTGTAGSNVRVRKVGNGLTGPIPPELGNLSELRVLSLSSNNLTGPIAVELGDLSELQGLSLVSNNLTGPIPVELGDLSNLGWLWLSGNDFSTSIPPELGKLSNLTFLHLGNAGLTGSIPVELGRLSNLTTLILERNDLRGPIPAELGRLANLDTLDLGRNGLTGPIPTELGHLPRLLQLLLSNNELTGPVPDALGALATLEGLELTNNAGMSGALPSSLTALARLDALLAEGTGLCSPTDSGFLTWLEGIPKQRIASCAVTGASQAYLTQSVQSREFPVPLVANRQALLRVFPTTREATSEGIPSVRASFYLNGTAAHVVDIPAKSTAIPTEVHEGSLATSANAEIPASVVQPGLEMVVEIDPDGTLDAALGVTKRIPETGRMAIDVRAMPTLDMTLVPFLWSGMPDSSILDIVEGLSPEDELFWMTRTLLPVGDFDLRVHEPLLTSTNNTFTMLHETEAVWVMEGRRGHYVGTIAGELTGPRGGGSLDARVMFMVLGPSIHDPEYVMAHELGHTMSLLHTPCGGANNQDPSYPYSNGSIGVWGYDFRDGGSLVAPHNRDVMSYCGTGVEWISDYHFTNALRYRLFDERPPQMAAKSLLLWGGMDPEGEPFLEPAFVVDAPAALPDSAGEYRVTGRTASGGELFSLSFTMPETADGDGSSSFVFALPVQPGWEGNLASITLSGSGGSVILDRESDRPMGILRNPRTGQVRGILRDLPQADAAAALAPQAGPGSLDMLFSRGIPDAGAWGR